MRKEVVGADDNAAPCERSMRGTDARARREQKRRLAFEASIATISQRNSGLGNGSLRRASWVALLAVTI